MGRINTSCDSLTYSMIGYIPFRRVKLLISPVSKNEIKIPVISCFFSLRHRWVESWNSEGYFQAPVWLEYSMWSPKRHKILLLDRSGEYFKYRHLLEGEREKLPDFFNTVFVRSSLPSGTRRRKIATVGILLSNSEQQKRTINLFHVKTDRGNAYTNTQAAFSEWVLIATYNLRRSHSMTPPTLLCDGPRFHIRICQLIINYRTTWTTEVNFQYP